METLTEMLIRDEGLRLKPYKCTAGKTSIGCGRNLDDNGISEQEAMILLRNDIHAARTELSHTFPWIDRLDPVRRDVLANMCFNLGLPTLMQFRNMLEALIEKDYDDAAREMLDSRWARQVGPRAERLARMMVTGEYV